MTQKSSLAAPLSAQDRLGRALAAHLTQGQANVSPDIAERLRIARQQAVAQRKTHALPRLAPHRRAAHLQTTTGASSAARAPGPDRLSAWQWMASALPLLALVLGLVLIPYWHAQERAKALAEIDAALLTDELPTAAYTDPGFKQFLLDQAASAASH